MQITYGNYSFVEYYEQIKKLVGIPWPRINGTLVLTNQSFQCVVCIVEWHSYFDV
jgi:hypothetical protein